ncbi:hypothetical protein I7I48_08022 [Histoplasma ohiense]|nr:hypothetical protein I7I48_08022 [Histoplasma ohiense (nom. inval.)]
MHRPNPRQERPTSRLHPAHTRTTNISPSSLPCILAKGDPVHRLGLHTQRQNCQSPPIVHLILRQKSPINIQQPFLDS